MATPLGGSSGDALNLSLLAEELGHWQGYPDALGRQQRTANGRNPLVPVHSLTTRSIERAAEE